MTVRDFSTNFKNIAYRNQRILDAAKGRACTRCGRNDGTTVAAHSNDKAHGRGTGRKADDCFIAFLCFFCHNAYDHRDTPVELYVTQEEFNTAMHRTWKLLLEMGALK